MRLLLQPSRAGSLPGAREIPAPWSFLSYYSAKNSNRVKKCRLKQRLFASPRASLALLSQGRRWTGSDALLSPVQAPNTASVTTGVRQIVWRERENTHRETTCIISPCTGARPMFAKHPSGPRSRGRCPAWQAPGTRSEDTCLLPWGSLQNPHGTIQTRQMADEDSRAAFSSFSREV